jgi:hypothetical protein
VLPLDPVEGALGAIGMETAPSNDPLLVSSGALPPGGLDPPEGKPPLPADELPPPEEGPPPDDEPPPDGLPIESVAEPTELPPPPVGLVAWVSVSVTGWRT